MRGSPQRLLHPSTGTPPPKRQAWAECYLLRSSPGLGHRVPPSTTPTQPLLSVPHPRASQQLVLPGPSSSRPATQEGASGPRGGHTWKILRTAWQEEVADSF